MKLNRVVVAKNSVTSVAVKIQLKEACFDSVLTKHRADCLCDVIHRILEQQFAFHVKDIKVK